MKPFDMEVVAHRQAALLSISPAIRNLNEFYLEQMLNNAKRLRFRAALGLEESQ